MLHEYLWFWIWANGFQLELEHPPLHPLDNENQPRVVVNTDLLAIGNATQHMVDGHPTIGAEPNVGAAPIHF